MTTPMHACTDLLSGHEWRDNDHEFYYPAVSAAVSSAGTTSIGRLWDSSVFVNKAQVKLKKEKAAIEKKNRKAAKYPLRIAIPAPIQGEMLQTILTNHFEIGIDAQHLYQYEILDLKGEGRTKKKIQALFNRALVAWPYLDNKKANFATDNQRTIISWVNLHENLPFPPIISGDGPNNAGAQWPKQDITTGNNPIGANLKFVGMVEISKLLNRSKAELSEVRTDVTAIERCINIIISKSFDHEIFRHSPDKFFVKKSRSTFYHKVNNVKHHSTSLEIMRGYYYAVKPGMGCLLMNFNVATSAFFRPILVSQFLEDDDTFSSPVQRMAILSKLRVYVDPKHKEERLNKFGARIKTIHSVGDNNNPDHNIEDSTFHKKRKGADGRPIVDAQGNYVYEQNPTHVTDHIKDCK